MDIDLMSLTTIISPINSIPPISEIKFKVESVSLTGSRSIGDHSSDDSEIPLRTPETTQRSRDQLLSLLCGA